MCSLKRQPLFVAFKVCVCLDEEEIGFLFFREGKGCREQGGQKTAWPVGSVAWRSVFCSLGYICVAPFPSSTRTWFTQAWTPPEMGYNLHLWMIPVAIKPQAKLLRALKAVESIKWHRWNESHFRGRWLTWKCHVRCSIYDGSFTYRVIKAGNGHTYASPPTLFIFPCLTCHRSICVVG